VSLSNDEALRNVLDMVHKGKGPAVLSEVPWKGDVLEISEKSIRCRIRGSHSGGYEEFCLLGYNAV
jgi:hypothetical protein